MFKLKKEITPQSSQLLNILASFNQIVCVSQNQLLTGTIFPIINVHCVTVATVYGSSRNVNKRRHGPVTRNGMEMWEKGGVARGAVI